MAEQNDRRARVCCDGEQIRAVLTRKTWTQRALAGEMAKLRPSGGRSLEDVGESERRILARVLAGANVTVATAERVARALNVPLGDILDVNPEADAHGPTVLGEIRRCDQAGEFERAIRLGARFVERCRLAMKRRRDVDPHYGEACVQLASVFDHRQDWDAGIRLLDEYLDDPGADRAAFHHDRLWARYQRAVLRRNRLTDMLGRSFWQLPAAVIDAEIRECHQDLDFVGRLADEALRIAVDHQRGVLALLQGDLAKALALFEDALARREQLARMAPHQGGRHRLAYELRRIAQCLAHLGRDPRPALTRAMRIATAEGHERIRRELAADKPVLLALFRAGATPSGGRSSNRNSQRKKR